ncbi:MAG TPA: metal ABC transporter permease [Candidatus Methylacidiphilales bacterium]|jgi:zinc/manganese transport system permease protein|nr:metal ABC transporter permease [Candidatus Methylacidiphilales bacterium]
MTMIDKLTNYLGYEFVQNALMAGTLAAILGAIVGYFVIIRNAGFAAHALAHIGFAGAAGAAILGLSSLEGMLLLTVGSGLFMGAAGDKVHRNDLAIGMVLSMALGLGTLFLSLYSGFAGQAKSILFGNIFGVSGGQITEMVSLSLLSLAGLAVFSRRLLFASTQPRLAEARGLSLPGLSMAFMAVLAVSVTLASQIVGILLVFTLVIAPAGIALRLCRSFWWGISISVGLGVTAVWIGILLDCMTGYPATFWITALFFVLYILVEAYSRLIARLDY